jgi:hypothetical protein
MAIILAKLLEMKSKLMTFLALFSSLTTILCCALPIILVTLGLGAAFASLTSNFPFIIFLAEKAIYLFIIAAILLAISGYFIFVKEQSCPADKKLVAICLKSKKFNKYIWWTSLIILAISFFFKYILILLV